MEPPVTPSSVASSTRSSHNVLLLRIVAVLELVSGLISASAVPYLLSHLSQLGSFLVTFYFLTAVAGLVGSALLWRMSEWGWKLSACLQAVQIPYFASRAFPYSFVGLNLLLKAGWLGSDGLPDHELGVNVLAGALLVVLLNNLPPEPTRTAASDSGNDTIE